MTTETTAYIAYGVLLTGAATQQRNEVLDLVEKEDGLCCECSGDDSELRNMICISKTVYQTYWMPLPILVEDLTVQPEWDEKLKSCCEKLFLTAQREPGWYLFYKRL